MASIRIANVSTDWIGFLSLLLQPDGVFFPPWKLRMVFVEKEVPSIWRFKTEHEQSRSAKMGAQLSTPRDAAFVAPKPVLRCVQSNGLAQTIQVAG